MAPLALALALGSFLASSPDPGPGAPFAGCPAPTGSSATMLIPALPDVVSPTGRLEPGDVLAVYADGTCVGQATWDGAALALAVWADDPFTLDRDGFVPGDAFQLQVWDASTGAAHSDGVAISFEEGFDTSGGLGADHVYVVAPAGATASDDGPLAGEAEVGTPYPNPAVAGARLSVRCGTPQRVAADVYDTTGRRVAQLPEQTVSGRAELDLDTHGLAPGLYVVRVTGETFAETRRLTVVR